jgi:hypoxanthine phosphoribosyltransferase
MRREKYFLSYEEYGELLDDLVRILRYQGFNKDISPNICAIKDVFGIPRGGMPIAVHLSHHIPLDILSVNNFELNLLIVDDISDTGRSFKKHLLSECRNYGCSGWTTTSNVIPLQTTASLFITPWTEFIPSFFVKMTTDWIVFPWEKE